jgi:tripartite ATP-independent transporter DctM subunit
MIAVVFAALLFASVPIALVLALTAAFYIVWADNSVLFGSYHAQMFGGIESYGLMAIPLFILVGEFMNAGGITRRLLELAGAIIGRVKGGLAYINLLANMFMAAILGSALAQIAIMTQVMVPEMERKGYDKPFAVATTAAAGMLSPIIPPSMLFVIYGVLAQVSIGDMFIAGVIPGLMMTAAFFVVIAFLGWWKYEYPYTEKHTARERVRNAMRATPALSIPVCIIGGIVGGIATPTEPAAVAAAASFLLGKFVYKELRLREIHHMLYRTAMSASLVLFLVAAANVFGWVLVFEKVPQAVAVWIQAVADSPIAFMLLVNVLLLIVGALMDGIAALIMVVPILQPIAENVYGVDDFHFGVVVCINLVLGILTPPVGAGLFVASAMTGLKPGQIFLPCVPFVIVTMGLLVVLSIWPWFTLALLR